MNITPLIDLINKHVSLNHIDIEMLESIIKVEAKVKGDVVVTSGQVCKELKFVRSGIYRVYKLLEGKEITTYFNTVDRNPFLASFVSLLTNSPSKEIVECIGDGELLTVSYQDWQALYRKSDAMNTFGRLMAELNYVLAMERIEALQYHSAKTRYESFLKLYPNLMNYIPHHYIASYIGVAPESLSRIRKQS